MYPTRCVSSLLYCLFAIQAFAAGPFGFEYGMTREQVLKLVGPGAVETDRDNGLGLNTAPKPHPSFESYLLIFSSDRGLLKVIAVGKNVTTTRFGYELRTAFAEMKDLMVKNYGSAEIHDHLNRGSIWNEPADWMMGLQKKERDLVAFWNLPLPNHLEIIELAASALSPETGYLRLSYEFEGFSQYIADKKAKAGSVL